MIVYKFGGASIKDEQAIRKMAEIVQQNNEKKIVVISAMGKTTNRLETIARKYFQKEDFSMELDELIDYHQLIIDELFENYYPDNLNTLYEDLENRLKKAPSLDYNYEYDQIVSFGEILSTKIIASYFNHLNVKMRFVDIRDVIKTDRNFRDATVIWELTGQFARDTFTGEDADLYITQGFIAASTNNLTTTIGREGSDYTAAILAAACNAEKMVVWKDVPGIMNADPKWIPSAEKIDHLSYNEAIELAYYGAKVIHPNTIKPLKDKEIPLFVNSFIDPEKSGSLIDKNGPEKYQTPIFIRKENQILISIKPRDFGLISEENIRKIFEILAQLRMRVHLTQVSAISFTFCVDRHEKNFAAFSAKVKDLFFTRYNSSAELITIRHYTGWSIERMHQNGKVLIEQRTRKTAQIIRVYGE